MYELIAGTSTEKQEALFKAYQYIHLDLVPLLPGAESEILVTHLLRLSQDKIGCYCFGPFKVSRWKISHILS